MREARGTDATVGARPRCCSGRSTCSCTSRAPSTCPPTGPVVVAATHVAYPDFMTLAAAGRERGRFVRFLTRHDVWNVPVARRAMTGMRHVPVDREAPAAAYLHARRLLREGEAVGLFPEAGISHSYGAGADARRGRRWRGRPARRWCRPRSGASSGSGGRSAGRGTQAAAEPAPRPAHRPAVRSAAARPARRRPRAPGHRRARGRRSPGCSRSSSSGPHHRPRAGRARPVVPRPPRRPRARPARGARRSTTCPTQRGPAHLGSRRTLAVLGWPVMASTPKRQRVAAYAVIVRDDQILLSRLSPLVTPRRAVDPARRRARPRRGPARRGDPRDPRGDRARRDRERHRPGLLGPHAAGLAQRPPGQRPRRPDRLRRAGWRRGSPEPRVVEVDGSTIEAAWQPLADVLDGERAGHAAGDRGAGRPPALPAAAGGGVRPGPRGPSEVLLTRVSPQGFHTGLWSLPGGGIEHGERPAAALVREVREECGVDGRGRRAARRLRRPLLRHRARAAATRTSTA